MRTMTLAACEVPVLGQGTWHMGDSPQRRTEELATLRLGIELGMTLIDTAEMYGAGNSERLVGEAIAGRRDEVFLVSKVLPSHADRVGVVQACEASLRRLGTDHVDLYLLHWRSSSPIEETVAGFEELRRQGKVGAWGVSNFDANAIDGFPLVPGAGNPGPAAPALPAVDQVLYNLRQRWPEAGLLNALRDRSVPLMAYSPVEEGELTTSTRAGALARVAARHGVSAAQIALAWVIRLPGVLAIPKASTPAHVRENAAAGDLGLTPEDLAELDAAYPPPSGPAAMQMH